MLKQSIYILVSSFPYDIPQLFHLTSHSYNLCTFILLMTPATVIKPYDIKIIYYKNLHSLRYIYKYLLKNLDSFRYIYIYYKTLIA